MPDGPLVRGPLVRGPLVRGSLVRGRLVLGLVLHQLQQPVLLLRLLGSGRPAATTHTAGVHEGEAARDSAQTPVGLAMTDGEDRKSDVEGESGGDGAGEASTERSGE